MFVGWALAHQVKIESRGGKMIDNTSSIESVKPVSQMPVNTEQTANKASASNATKTENVKAEQIIAQAKEAKNAERNAITPDEMTQVVENLNAFVQIMKRNVSFDIDKDSGRDVISVFDADTRELIRQIPSEEALKLLKRMDEAVGLLFSEKV